MDARLHVKHQSPRLSSDEPKRSGRTKHCPHFSGLTLQALVRFATRRPMSDLADVPGIAGNGMTSSPEIRKSFLQDANGATSPTAPRSSSQASLSADQPKKKRKVNHGQFMLPGRRPYSSTDTSPACVYCRRSVSKSDLCGPESTENRVHVEKHDELTAASVGYTAYDLRFRTTPYPSALTVFPISSGIVWLMQPSCEGPCLRTDLVNAASRETLGICAMTNQEKDMATTRSPRPTQIPLAQRSSLLQRMTFRHLQPCQVPP